MILLWKKINEADGKIRRCKTALTLTSGVSTRRKSDHIVVTFCFSRLDHFRYKTRWSHFHVSWLDRKHVASPIKKNHRTERFGKTVRMSPGQKNVAKCGCVFFGM
mmetsp:Transcript_12490/g.18505  ORF Transcript_12490/g.18505 Transcript_12490/m.18505 type:complete len:105 (-) Transcript_12490:100-414(-)